MADGVLRASFSGVVVASPGSTSNDAAFYLCVGARLATGPCAASTPDSNYFRNNAFNTTTAFSFSDLRFPSVSGDVVVNILEYFCHPGPCGVSLQPGAMVEVHVVP